jgi:hypothetical protein
LSGPITLNGSCHCGAVAVTGSIDGFRITHDAGKLATYRFNTRTAQHHFCTACGIYNTPPAPLETQRTRRQLRLSRRRLPLRLPEIVVYDGTRHPADNPHHKTYVAGVLKFEPV